MVDQQESWEWDDSDKAIAIPEADILSWLGRPDRMTSPRYVAFRFAIKDDPRYWELVSACEHSPVTVMEAIGAMVMIAGSAIRLGGVLAIKGRAVKARQLAHQWSIDPERLEPTVDILLRTGWFDLVPADTKRGGPGITDTSRGLRRDESRPDKTRGVGTTLPNPVKSSRPVKSEEAPDPEVSEPKGRPSSSPSKVRGSAALGDLLRHAMAGNITAGRDTTHVMMKISKAIRDIREENGKHPWPENPSDRSDLKRAVQTAIRRAALPLLISCLEEAAGWANNGAGFRDAMSKAGLL